MLSIGPAEAYLPRSEGVAEADGNRTRSVESAVELPGDAGGRVRAASGLAGPPERFWRRRTGIEPAHRGSPGAPVLKTGRDTSPLSPPGSRAKVSPGANSTGNAGAAAPSHRSGLRGPRLRAGPA